MRTVPWNVPDWFVFQQSLSVCIEVGIRLEKPRKPPVLPFCCIGDMIVRQREASNGLRCQSAHNGTQRRKVVDVFAFLDVRVVKSGSAQ